MAALDHPQMEDLRSVHHVVRLADALAQSLMLISGEAGYDAVNQCGAEIIILLQPCLKLLAQLPQVGVFQAALLQFFPVMIDQLAGQNDKAL